VENDQVLSRLSRLENDQVSKRIRQQLENDQALSRLVNVSRENQTAGVVR
jgi:hypothetical protein